MSYRYQDPDYRWIESDYSDADVLAEAARIAKNAVPPGPAPKSAASIVRWLRWNDPDGEFGHLRKASLEDAMFALRQYLTDAEMAYARRKNPRKKAYARRKRKLYRGRR